MWKREDRCLSERGSGGALLAVYPSLWALWSLAPGSGILWAHILWGKPSGVVSCLARLSQCSQGKGQGLLHWAPLWCPCAPIEEEKDSYLFIKLPRSVQLRCSERAHGEAMCNVLRSTLVPLTKELLQPFKLRCWLSESDHAGANDRAERLLHTCRRRGADSVGAAALLCGTSRTQRSREKHAIAACPNLWSRSHSEVLARPEGHEVTTTAAPQTCLLELEGGTEEVLGVVRSSVGLQADTRVHRLASALLNSDWRVSSHMEHVCLGCCSSDQECHQKVVASLLQISHSMKTMMFHRGNWKPSEGVALVELFWPLWEHSPDVGAGAAGYVGGAASEADAEPLGPQNEEFLEGFEKQRRERAKSARIASQWHSGFTQIGCSEWSWTPRLSLCTSSYILHQWATMSRSSPCVQKKANANTTSVTFIGASICTSCCMIACKMLVQRLGLCRTQKFSGQTSWSCAWGLPHTSDWQTVELRWASCPYRVFSLLHDHTPANAERLLSGAAWNGFPHSWNHVYHKAGSQPKLQEILAKSSDLEDALAVLSAQPCGSCVSTLEAVPWSKQIEEEEEAKLRRTDFQPVGAPLLGRSLAACPKRSCTFTTRKCPVAGVPGAGFTVAVPPQGT